jgi:lipopolysaccharide heptosyltransferase II
MNSWRHCKNILVVRLDNMGDVLLTSPAFRALKESFPGVKLTLLTSSMGAEIAKYIPSIDDVIIFDTPWVKLHESVKGKEIVSFVELLVQSKFDGAIIFTNSTQSSLPTALLCYMANIPLRLAFCHVNPNQLLTDWVPDNEPYTLVRHGVQRQLALVSHIGAETSKDNLSLAINEDVSLRVDETLHAMNISKERPVVILHPGVSEVKRQYPLALFAKAAEKIIHSISAQVIVTGSASEKGLVDSLIHSIKIENTDKSLFSMVGKFSLEEFIALIGLSDIVISNNTGPVHIAAAVGKPVVDLYARSNPEHTPWKTKQRVLYFDVPKHLQTKSPMLLHMIPSVEKLMPQPEHIVIAVEELLHNSEESKLPKEITTW